MNVSVIKKFLRLWQAKSLVLMYVLLGLSTYAAHGADQVVINYAWYGTQDDWNKNGQTQQKASIVVNKLKEVVEKYGFLVIPNEQNKFYGFDPLFGTVKATAIDATVNGARKIDYRAPEGADFVLPASLAGTPQVNAALAEIKAALAPASTSTSGAPITYGSTIKLSFPAIAGAGLHSHGFNYWHDASSKQQQVTGKLLGDGGDNWIVMGPFGTAATYQLGAPVANGAKIRLAYPQTNGWLHVQALDKYKSPDQKLLEVSVLNNSVVAGGNTGDDWIVTTSDGQSWTDGSSITLRPATYSTSSYLTAGTTTFNVRQAAGGTDNQRVVGLGLSPAYWRASILKPAVAAVVEPAQTDLVIHHAWFGREDAPAKVNIQTAPKVVEKLRASIVVENGRSVIKFPASLVEFFGIDPIPGQQKVLAIDATVNGVRKNDYRVQDGLAQIFPAGTVVAAPGAPAPAVQTDLVINYAWFGSDVVSFQINKRTAKRVMAKLRDSIVLENGRGVIKLPANLVEYFGFDPLPGMPKVLAISATINGVKKKDYRILDGVAQTFPLAYEAEKAAADAAKLAVDKAAANAIAALAAAEKAAADKAAADKAVIDAAAADKAAAEKVAADAAAAKAVADAAAKAAADAAESAAADALVVPEDFEEEGGPAYSIAVGSRNGKLEAWMIDFDGKLYRYNNYTMASDPWTLMDANGADGKPLAGSLRDVSVSSDGVMCVLDGNSKAFMYDWDKKVFNAMVESPENKGISFDFISVGSKNNIVAVDEDGNILTYSNSGWEVIQEGEAMQAAAGIDGTILALNTDGQAYNYLGDSKWDDMPGARLARIALGSARTIWGVGDSGELYTYSGDLADTGDTAESDVTQSPDQQAGATVTVQSNVQANKWQPRQGGRKAARGKKAQKAAGKKGQKKSARKNARAANAAGDVATTVNIALPVTTVATAPVQIQDGQTTHVGRWIQVQGKGGKSATGFESIAVNNAGTVFATGMDGIIYHKGDAGAAGASATATTASSSASSVGVATGVAAGAVVGAAVAADVPTATDSGKMTRRQARKAGKLDAAGGKKKQSKWESIPNTKEKSRPGRKEARRGKKQAVAAS